MNNSLQEYFNEYITTPDYDLNNPMSQQFFFQDGGFARFFPVLPGGYQPIQAVQGQNTGGDQHALWNSFANNGIQLGRVLGNQRLLNQQLQINKDRLAYQKEADALDLQYKREALDQRRYEFGINSAVDQIKLMSTIQDKYLNLPVLPQDIPDYKTVISDYKIDQYAKELESATSPEASIQALQKLAGATSGMAADSRFREIQANILRRDKDLEFIKTIPDDQLKYYKLNKYFNELSSGVKGPNGGLPTLDFDQTLFDQDQEINRNLQQEKAYAAKAGAMLKEQDAKQAEVALGILNANLLNKDGTPKSPEEQMLAYQKFNSDIARMTASRQPQLAQNEFGFMDKFGDEMGLTPQQQWAEINKYQSNKNNLRYHADTNPFDGRNPTSPGYNIKDQNWVTQELGKAIQGQNPIGYPKPLPPSIQLQMGETLTGSKNYTFHGNNPNDDGENGVKGEGNFSFIPNTVKVNGKNDPNNAGKYLAEPNGFTTFKGTIITKDKNTALKFDKDAKPVNPGSATPEYRISDVEVTVPNTGVEGIGFELPSNLTSQNNIINLQGGYQAMQNLDGSYIVRAPDGQTLSMTKQAYENNIKSGKLKPQ